MTPQPVIVEPASLSNVLYLLDRYQLSRLPVIEGRKLVGIITRADIIRAEADKLNFKTGQMDPGLSLPTWFIKRNPKCRAGTVAVPLANPQTAASLLQLAAAIARDRHRIGVSASDSRATPVPHLKHRAQQKSPFATRLKFCPKVENSCPHADSGYS